MMPLKILVVSENKVLVRNLFEWYRNRLDNGSLVIDHAHNKDEAEAKMKEEKYDKIFHNGLYIIDSIEKLQFGADVWKMDGTNNKYGNVINTNDKKRLKKIISGKHDIWSLNHLLIVAVFIMACTFVFWTWKISGAVMNNGENIQIIKTHSERAVVHSDSLLQIQKDVVGALNKIIEINSNLVKNK